MELSALEIMLSCTLSGLVGAMGLWIAYQLNKSRKKKYPPVVFSHKENKKKESRR